MASPTLLWFRWDLRLQDNPALAAALERGGPVVPVYIRDDAAEARWVPGGASRWWLHHSLASLDAALRERGSRLLLARGDSLAELCHLIAATGAGAVYWNRRYEPALVARDREVERELTDAALEVRSFNSALLFEPHTVANKQSGPFRVFGPFWRHCLGQPVASPVRVEKRHLKPMPNGVGSLNLAELELLPRPNWAGGIEKTWQPGEAGAQMRLKRFLKNGIHAYATRRDRPADEGTSQLSPHLHFGEVGPRQVWAAVQELGREQGVFPPSEGARVFLSEVGWREFAYHLLSHFPQTPEAPLREEFAEFPWAADPGDVRLSAWQRGRTGYPIVDAGMRQVWTTGWMHNRVRMVVASFLVKHLRLPWQRGAQWFWDTLVDADLANNTLGWQWSAGCGADAAPYFRIFAPVLQGEKFDPAGDYVRRWVPELAKLPSRFIHRPWEAPEEVLAAADVRLGKNYPRPIVDHAQARAAALRAFQEMKR